MNLKFRGSTIVWIRQRLYRRNSESIPLPPFGLQFRDQLPDLFEGQRLQDVSDRRAGYIIEKSRDIRRNWRYLPFSKDGSCMLSVAGESQALRRYTGVPRSYPIQH
jgi:hypothetical protein